jgi:hypothetical protein
MAIVLSPKFFSMACHLFECAASDPNGTAASKQLRSDCHGKLQVKQLWILLVSCELGPDV